MLEYLSIIFGICPLLFSTIALVWLIRSKQYWLIRVFVSAAIAAFTFMTGPWAFTSYYLKYAFLGLLVILVVISHPGFKSEGKAPGEQRRRFSFSSIFLLLLFMSLNGLAISSYYYTGPTINLSFPLKSGTYYVLQGGTSIVTNPFHALRRSKCALDIVKLNHHGNRADGIAPPLLSNYNIYDEVLFSPCQGIVLRVRNNLEDNPPGIFDAANPLGNYIAMQCDEAEVLLGHLKHRSIQVNPGDTLNIGQPMAAIGNSGFTLEPHLHIEANRDSIPLGMKFNGRMLSINSLVVN